MMPRVCNEPEWLLTAWELAYLAYNRHGSMSTHQSHIVGAVLGEFFRMCGAYGLKHTDWELYKQCW